MDAYENTAGMWIVGEDMPQESNRVTLNTALKDQWGLPSPTSLRRPPQRRRDAGARLQPGRPLYESVGATGTHHTPPYPATHNLGTCRMSEKPQTA